MRTITRIGVLGAGTMGAGIAQVAAEAGIRVLLHDPLPDAVRGAQTRIDAALARRVARGQMSNESAGEVVTRIAESPSLAGLAAADLVVEAIPEDLGLKREAFHRLDAAAGPHTILASNTSSLSIAAIAAATGRPRRVVGMHFFNPVPAMQLVEVIGTGATDPTVVDATAGLARAMGKTPVLAADTPGFIVNRVARPYYLEALRLAEEGLAGVEQIDAAMRAAGFRMGPFELIDAIGADVNLAVSRSVYQAFSGEARYAPRRLQEAVVAAGRLGRKAGAGFYDYAPDGTRGAPWADLPLPASSPPPGEQIAERILATIVNEAASALEARVATPEAIDVAMRLGTNYPWGPLEWGERIGLRAVVATLDRLHAGQPDGRYRAVALLRRLADRDGSFFEPPS